MPGPTAYPAVSVWNRVTKFCARNTSPSSDWTPVTPTAKTSLAYLAENPGWRIGAEGKPAKVFRSVVAGRTLFAFKRHAAEGGIGTGDCQVYDFEAVQPLIVADWAKVVDVLPQENEPELTQRMTFRLEARPGHILLRQQGYFPQLHSIGFVGIEIFISGSAV